MPLEEVGVWGDLSLSRLKLGAMEVPGLGERIIEVLGRSQVTPDTRGAARRTWRRRREDGIGDTALVSHGKQRQTRPRSHAVQRAGVRDTADRGRTEWSGAMRAERREENAKMNRRRVQQQHTEK